MQAIPMPKASAVFTPHEALVVSWFTVCSRTLSKEAIRGLGAAAAASVPPAPARKALYCGEEGV
jgi:hypothetical protein